MNSYDAFEEGRRQVRAALSGSPASTYNAFDAGRQQVRQAFQRTTPTMRAISAGGLDPNQIMEEATQPKTTAFQWLLSNLAYIPKLEAQFTLPTPWYRKPIEAFKVTSPTIGQVLSKRMKPGWKKTAAVFASDVLLDPITYLGPIGVAKGALRGAMKEAGMVGAKALMEEGAAKGMSQLALRRAPVLAGIAGRFGEKTPKMADWIERSIGAVPEGVSAEREFLRRVVHEGAIAGKMVPKYGFGFGVPFTSVGKNIVSPETMQRLGTGLTAKMQKVPVISELLKIGSTAHLTPSAYVPEAGMSEIEAAVRRGDVISAVKGLATESANLGDTYMAPIVARIGQYMPKERQVLNQLSFIERVPLPLRQKQLKDLYKEGREAFQKGQIDLETHIGIMRAATQDALASRAEVLAKIRPELHEDAISLVTKEIPGVLEQAYLKKRIPESMRGLTAVAATTQKVKRIVPGQVGRAVEPPFGTMGVKLVKAGPAVRMAKPPEVAYWLQHGRSMTEKEFERYGLATPLKRELQTSGLLPQRELAKYGMAQEIRVGLFDEFSEELANELLPKAAMAYPKMVKKAQDVLGLKFDNIGQIMDYISTHPFNETRERLLPGLAETYTKIARPGYQPNYLMGVPLGKATERIGKGMKFGAPAVPMSELAKTFKSHPNMREHSADYLEAFAKFQRDAGGNLKMASDLEKAAKIMRPEKDILFTLHHRMVQEASHNIRERFAENIALLGKTAEEAARLHGEWAPLSGWDDFAPMKGLLFPKEVQEAINKIAPAINLGENETKQLAKYTHEFMQIFKSSAVAGFSAPRWIMGNVAGTGWSFFLDNITNGPKRIAQGLRAIAEPEVAPGLERFAAGQPIRGLRNKAQAAVGKAVTPIAPEMLNTYRGRISIAEAAQLYNKVGPRGMIGGDIDISGLSRGTLHIANKIQRYNPLAPQEFFWTRAWMSANNSFERASQLGMFFEHLERGQTEYEAIAAVRKYLFDYGDLTNWEKKWGKGIFPFYTWIRKNTALQFRTMLEQPGKPGAAAKTINASESIGPDYPEDLKPEWMNRVGAFRVPSAGAPSYALPMLPATDIARLFTWQQAVGSMHPFINYIVKRIMEKDPLTGKPVTGAEAAFGVLPWFATPLRVAQAPPGRLREQLTGLWTPVKPYKVNLVKQLSFAESAKRSALADARRWLEYQGRIPISLQKKQRDRKMANLLRRRGVDPTLYPGG